MCKINVLEIALTKQNRISEVSKKKFKNRTISGSILETLVQIAFYPEIFKKCQKVATI